MEEKKKSLSLFSADTLDSLAMAEVFGGADNCNGGNCVKQCSCTITTSNVKAGCGPTVPINAAAGCGSYNTSLSDPFNSFVPIEITLAPFTLLNAVE